MTKLVIDTDPGVDDAHALMLAFAHPDAEVVALTTVNGNVPIKKTTANACTILDVLGADVPVYAGCSRPLIAAPHHAYDFHGKDGLGDAGYGTSTRAVAGEHAVHALIRLANEAPGELTLVAIGPLTNVAMAVRLDPELPSKYKKLVVMGGAIRGMGNATPAAEFNFYADPEAVAIVFEAWPELTLVSWETTMAYGVPPEQLDVLMSAQTPRGEFYRRTSTNTVAYLERALGYKMMFEPDLLAVAAAIEPDIVTKAEVHAVQIELAGQHTRGQSTVDWWDRSGQTPNVNLVLEMDRERLWALLRMMVA